MPTGGKFFFAIEIQVDILYNIYIIEFSYYYALLQGGLIKKLITGVLI